MTGHDVLHALDLVTGTVEREAAVEAERKRIADAKPKMLLTVRQQAEQAGISESQVRSLIVSGRLEHVIGSRVMVPVGAFENFLQTETVKPCRDETKGQSSAPAVICPSDVVEAALSRATDDSPETRPLDCFAPRFAAPRSGSICRCSLCSRSTRGGARKRFSRCGGIK